MIDKISNIKPCCPLENTESEVVLRAKLLAKYGLTSAQKRSKVVRKIWFVDKGFVEVASEII